MVKKKRSNLVNTVRLFNLINDKKSLDNKCSLDFFVPKELVYFKGHFNELPILPGIAQLDLVIHYANEYLKIEKAQISSVHSMKFMKIIKPLSSISLTLEQKNNNLLFKYYDTDAEDIVYSSGKIGLTGIIQ